MRDLRGVASYEAPALAHAAGHPRRRSAPSKPRANLWESLHNTRLHSPVNPDGRRAVIGDAIHQLSYEVPLPRAELPINRFYRHSHMSITTYYRHSLRRNMPIFAGCPMSYNGNTAGYRHDLIEHLAVLANGGQGSRIDSCKP